MITRRSALGVLVAGAALPAAAAQPHPLLGRWTVSLFFSPDAPPSRTEFVVRGVAEDRLSGTFYGSEIAEGRVVARGEDWVFAGVTADGTGEYLHSARLVGDAIDGQTLSRGRGFLMAWRAERP